MRSLALLIFLSAGFVSAQRTAATIVRFPVDNGAGIRSSDAGSYTVTATNSSGRVTSIPAVITIR